MTPLENLDVQIIKLQIKEKANAITCRYCPLWSSNFGYKLISRIILLIFKRLNSQ